MKVPIQDKAREIHRQLGVGETELSNIESRFRAQSGHTGVAIFYQRWEGPTFFSLPVIILFSLHILPLRFLPSPSSAHPVKSVWVWGT